MKEEYGSGFDGTPEQALKYAQDTPGQELEVKRLLKVIRNKKMSKTLKIVKEVVKEKLLREQDTSGLKTTVTPNPFYTDKQRKRMDELVGRINKPPLPTKNPIDTTIDRMKTSTNPEAVEAGKRLGYIRKAQRGLIVNGKRVKSIPPPPSEHGTLYHLPYRVPNEIKRNKSNVYALQKNN